MPTFRTIDQLQRRLSGGGARPNLFEVVLPKLAKDLITNADIPWDAENFRFLCKSAALPASNVASIDIPFQGKILKVAGDRTFDTWTVTVINDENFKLRNAFEQWMRSISNLTDGSGQTNPNLNSVSAFVNQLSRTKSRTAADPPLKTYQFFGIFPTNVSSIDLSYDSSDTIEEFTVEFQVQYWMPYTTPSSTTNGTGNTGTGNGTGTGTGTNINSTTGTNTNTGG